MRRTCEMYAALLNRNVLAELLLRKLDEGPAVVTRRLIKGKALDTLPSHAFPKSMEKSAIVLLDQRTKLVPTIGAHAGLDLIECCVQRFSDGSVSPFVRLRSFAVSNRKTNGIEMRTQGTHSETEHCYALLTKIERTVEVTLHLPAAVLGASHVHEKMQGCKAHE